MDPLLVFAAGDLDTAGIAVDRELSPAWLAEHLADVGATADQPGTIKGRLSRSGTDDVVVRTQVRADVRVPCARCLAPTPVLLEGELSLLLRPGKVLPHPARTVRDADAKGEAPTAKRAAGEAATATGSAATGSAATGSAALAGLKAARAARGGAAGARGAAAGKSDRRPKLPRAERAAAGKLPEFEFSADEADHDLYDGETIVLDGFVREALLLEMPNFPLCSEDCPGIAPVPAEAGEASASAGEAASGSSVQTPGTKSLGDVLRAALAERSAAGTVSAAGKPRKR